MPQANFEDNIILISVIFTLKLLKKYSTVTVLTVTVPFH